MSLGRKATISTTAAVRRGLKETQENLLLDRPTKGRGTTLQRLLKAGERDPEWRR